MLKRLSIGLLSAGLLVTTVPGMAVAKDGPQDACKKGGWRHLVDASGRPFAGQGDCVGYAASSGGNGNGGFLLAIAFSDLNGDHSYDSEDVMVSKLVDIDGGGLGKGDEVRMGSAVSSLAPSHVAFRDSTFIVESVLKNDAGELLAVETANGEQFAWARKDGSGRPIDGWGGYTDGVNPIVEAWDNHFAGGNDYVVVEVGAPGNPHITEPIVDNEQDSDGSNDGFVDIEFP